MARTGRLNRYFATAALAAMALLAVSSLLPAADVEPASRPSSAPVGQPVGGALAPAAVDAAALKAVLAAPGEQLDAQKTKITPLASTNLHLGGATKIANPFRNCAFRYVKLGTSKMTGAPIGKYICVTPEKTLYPFTATTQFADLLAAEDTSKWKDKDYLDAAKLYVHLASVANQEGWKVLEKPDDFLKITFNMPKAGTPPDAMRKADAQKITPAAVTRDKDKVIVKFYTWTNIFGKFGEWTIEFGKDFKADFKDIRHWGGGGYD